MKLKEFIIQYYYPKSCAQIAQSTLNGYKSTINKYILPTFGDLEMEDISVCMIEDWLNGIEKKGAAEKAYKTLRQVLRKASDYNIFKGDDPTKKYIKVPKKKGYQPKILTAAEIDSLIKGFKGHYLESTVICAVILGLRRGEAFGLYWEDINFNTGQVNINKSYQRVNGKNIYLPTKTEKSTRYCYLPSFALERLKEIGLGKTGPICPVPSVDKRVKDYKDYCLSHNLPFTPFTNLRHSWATLALENGADIAVIANMLGHTEVSTAYNHYLRPRESQYKEIQNKMQNSLKVKKSFLKRVKDKIKN